MSRYHHIGIIRYHTEAILDALSMILILNEWYYRYFFIGSEKKRKEINSFLWFAFFTLFFPWLILNYWFGGIQVAHLSASSSITLTLNVIRSDTTYRLWFLNYGKWSLIFLLSKIAFKILNANHTGNENRIGFFKNAFQAINCIKQLQETSISWFIFASFSTPSFNVSYK